MGCYLSLSDVCLLEIPGCIVHIVAFGSQFRAGEDCSRAVLGKTARIIDKFFRFLPNGQLMYGRPWFSLRGMIWVFLQYSHIILNLTDYILHIALHMLSYVIILHMYTYSFATQHYW